jgi:ADP-heptose:LPS heptosyltransferase
LIAHFSDRGHLLQADRGRRYNTIVNAQGMRASELLMYLKGIKTYRKDRSRLFGI